MKKRTVALLCAAVMLLGVVFGGTMALLTNQAKPLINTFTTADISMSLTESTGPEYIMEPGAVLDKDPTVTVTADSASCYVFVKVTENNNTEVSDKKPVAWAIADGWTKVDGVDETVYYRVCEENAETKSFSVLKGDEVIISDQLTKDYMEKAGENKPQLIFTAYAIQRDWLKTEAGEEITAPDAVWALAKDAAKPTATT